MNFFLCSDLHLEGKAYEYQLPDADGVVLAGDIFVAARANRPAEKFFKACHEKYKWIVYVPGNHEHYHGDFDNTETEIRRLFDLWGVSSKIRFLTESSAGCIIDGVRFVGGTLWTDYNNGVLEDFLIAKKCMSDFFVIRKDGRDFHPNDAYSRHMLTRQQIVRQLEINMADGHPLPVVVVTHHGPLPEAIHPKYEGSILNASFASDLSAIVESRAAGPVQHWLFGHTHERLSFERNGIKFQTNPRGYHREFQDNPFDPNLVLEVIKP